MHVSRCVCPLIPTVATDARLVVIMHRRERHKPTSTAHLAALALPNLEIRLRGFADRPVRTDDLTDGRRQVLLLYPHESSRLLTRELIDSDPRPVTLIVPDGSWRQAAKVPKREPSLQEVPCVHLPDLGPSRYHLRREPRPDGLATLEAIARALGIIEGPHAQAPLERLFQVMVERTMEARGTPLS